MAYAMSDSSAGAVKAIAKLSEGRRTQGAATVRATLTLGSRDETHVENHLLSRTAERHRFTVLLPTTKKNCADSKGRRSKAS